MNSGGSARTARAALFALVCVGAGTVLHRVADGCDPGWVGPALALPVTTLASFGLARRERHPLVVMLALGIAQLCLHIELGWFCPPAQGAMPGMPAGFGESATLTSGSASGAHSAAAMLAAHALAVLICGCWLGLGERSFFELCRALATLTRRAADRTAVLLAVRRAFRVLPISTRPARIHATARRTARPRGRPAPSPR
ncbi:hypothetical protein KDL01_41160, partial [Actinospica durhamensis]